MCEGKEEDVGLWLHPEAKVPPNKYRHQHKVRVRVRERNMNWIGLVTTQFPKLALCCLKSPFLGHKAKCAFALLWSSFCLGVLGGHGFLITQLSLNKNKAKER